VTATPASQSSPLKGWVKNGLPAFASAMAPWQDKLTQAHLISDWFQPQLDIVSAVLAPVASFTFWYLVRGLAFSTKWRLTLYSSIAFFVGIVSCVLLINLVDRVWFPPVYVIGPLRVTWLLLYILGCCSLGTTLAGGMLLAETASSKPTKRPPTEESGEKAG
jgi:hypothetical protein